MQAAEPITGSLLRYAHITPTAALATAIEFRIHPRRIRINSRPENGGEYSRPRSLVVEHRERNPEALGSGPTRAKQIFRR